MRTIGRSKPKTLTDRAKTAGSVVSGAAKATGNLAKSAGAVVTEGAKTARDRALPTSKSAPSGLETTRGKAVAAVGAAGAAVGAVAFWRKAQTPEPGVELDTAEDEAVAVAAVESTEAGSAEVAPVANGTAS
jgi:hypothetical protein